jgi:hypothetical protein
MAKAPVEIRSLARSHTERAIQVLAGIMDSSSAPESARVAAANSILDRGWGKAVQAVAGIDENEQLTPLVPTINLTIGPKPEPASEAGGGVPDQSD